MYYQVEKPFADFQVGDMFDFNGVAFIEFPENKFLCQATKQDIETLIKFGLIKELF